jgi:hypothetical protein
VRHPRDAIHAAAGPSFRLQDKQRSCHGTDAVCRVRSRQMPGWRDGGRAWQNNALRGARSAGGVGLGGGLPGTPALVRSTRLSRPDRVAGPICLIADEPRRKRRASPCGGRALARARSARTRHRAVSPRSITAGIRRGEPWPRWSRSSCARQSPLTGARRRPARRHQRRACQRPTRSRHPALLRIPHPFGHPRQGATQDHDPLGSVDIQHDGVRPTSS